MRTADSPSTDKIAVVQVMERAAEADGVSFGPQFVAAFAQSNEGDTSPNIQGAYCGQSGARRPPVASRRLVSMECL